MTALDIARRTGLPADEVAELLNEGRSQDELLALAPRRTPVYVAPPCGCRSCVACEFREARERRRELGRVRR